MEREIIVPAIYKHFKNKYYATMGIVKPVEGDIIQKLIGKPNVIMFEAEHTETRDIILIVRYKKIFRYLNFYGQTLFYQQNCVRVRSFRFLQLCLILVEK